MLFFGKKSENKLIKKVKYNKKYDWKEGKTHLDLFDTEVNVYIHNGVDEQYAENCIEHINNFSPSLKNYLAERLYKYYDFIRRECDWEEEHGAEIIIKDNEILFIGEFSGLGPWADKEYYKTVF